MLILSLTMCRALAAGSLPFSQKQPEHIARNKQQDRSVVDGSVACCEGGRRHRHIQWGSVLRFIGQGKRKPLCPELSRVRE